VAECRDAGIAVAMVTGDHPRTALAIARDLGIAAHDDEVVTGAQLADAGPPDGDAAAALVARGRVFARVSPLQKLHIVEALQRRGHFVAVTGDGVNDAPALKAANIGVAMGSGSDVTKDTASLIVTDDDFASIVAGVEEGRFAYENIRKVTLLVVSTGAAEVLLLLLALAVGLPLPLSAVQLLWLNLVTNGIQDVSLAFEGGEPGAMARPPRRPGEGLFDRLMVQQVVLGGLVMGGVTFGVWWSLLAAGVDEALARNELLLLFVLMQNVHVFNCRSERASAFRVPLRRNRVLVGGVVAAQGLHLLAMHLPFTQRLLGVRPVTPTEWAIAVGSALSILVVMETFKLDRAAAARRVTP
jgi:magnesium-transporting ATPase (P-type)